MTALKPKGFPMAKTTKAPPQAITFIGFLQSNRRGEIPANNTSNAGTPPSKGSTQEERMNPPRSHQASNHYPWQTRQDW